MQSRNTRMRRCPLHDHITTSRNVTSWLLSSCVHAFSGCTSLSTAAGPRPIYMHILNTYITSPLPDAYSSRRHNPIYTQRIKAEWPAARARPPCQGRYDHPAPPRPAWPSALRQRCTHTATARCVVRCAPDPLPSTRTILPCQHQLGNSRILHGHGPPHLSRSHVNPSSTP
jgi:hypothetical protein